MTALREESSPKFLEEDGKNSILLGENKSCLVLIFPEGRSKETFLKKIAPDRFYSTGGTKGRYLEKYIIPEAIPATMSMIASLLFAVSLFGRKYETPAIIKDATNTPLARLYMISSFVRLGLLAFTDCL